MRSHQAGRKEMFQVLLRAPIDNEGRPSHKVSPVMLRQFIHKSVSISGEYHVGNCARPLSLFVPVPSMNLWHKKKSKQASKCQGKNKVAQREGRASRISGLFPTFSFAYYLLEFLPFFPKSMASPADVCSLPW